MKIVFIQQPCFLQTQQRTNPLYDPIIEICEANGISWQIWLVDRNIQTGYPRKNVREYCWRDSMITACILLFNKLFRLPKEKSYVATGYILRFLKVLDSSVTAFMTNGLYQIEELSILYPKSRLVEIQHGILFPSHSGYFTPSGKIQDKIVQSKNLFFWFFGDRYKNIFLKNASFPKALLNKFDTVGDIRKKHDLSYPGDTDRNLIVLTSQLVLGTEFSHDTLLSMKAIYEKTLTEIFSLINTSSEKSTSYKILFRHHPRFFNCIDLSDWSQKFPDLITTDTRNWSEIYPQTKFALTLSSTSAFDAAAYEVPTVIIHTGNPSLRNILVEEFDYPLPTLTPDECLKMQPTQYREIQQKVHNWYQQYYSPFNPQNCLNLLKKVTGDVLS